MWKRSAAVVLVAAWGLFWWTHREIDRAPGVLVPEEPMQVAVKGLHPFNHAGARITPLANFDLRARVLGVKRYHFDPEASLAPYDLALGWGRMSDSAVLADIDISQGGRFYFWCADQLPIPRTEVITSSSNMHIIPGNDAVRHALGQVRRGHVVTLSGYLVMATNAKGGVWLSSMTRSDSGNGACELVWVESLEIE
ncbi:MAG: hypothetical protein R3C71_06200 [Candidatus Krumholzibacteriia bacterium]|nr:hypothetical protein [bacterium]